MDIKYGQLCGPDMFLIGFQTGKRGMTNVATSEKNIGRFSPQYENVTTHFFSLLGTFAEVLFDRKV